MAAALAFAAIPTAQVSAASLNVNAPAARVGNFGLEVAVGSTCSSGSDPVLSGLTLTGTKFKEGCNTLSASSVEIATAADVTFRAGESIALGNGFVVRDGARFTATIDPTLPRDAFVVNDSPAGETSYSAGFFLNLDNLTLLSSDQVDLLGGYGADGTPWFFLTVARNVDLGENRLILRARNNSASFTSTAGGLEVVFPSGWHWVEVDWKAASAGSSNGTIQLSLDGSPQSSLGTLTNDQGAIDRVQLGARAVEPGTTGSLALDAFDSRRHGPIPSPP